MAGPPNMSFKQTAPAPPSVTALAIRSHHLSQLGDLSAIMAVSRSVAASAAPSVVRGRCRLTPTFATGL